MRITNKAKRQNFQLILDQVYFIKVLSLQNKDNFHDVFFKNPIMKQIMMTKFIG